MAIFSLNPYKPIALGIGIAIILVLVTIIPVGQRTVSPLENISSLPLPTKDGVTTITESLAHADIQLKEPVLAKKLMLQIDFIPQDSKNLAVGIRENSFWYSYTPLIFFETSHDALSPQEIHHARVEIPLTDKLADRNQTLDMLLFTNVPVDPAKAVATTTQWQLIHIQATTAYTWPNMAELKDFMRSLLMQERVI